jgi:hypothetical protein
MIKSTERASEVGPVARPTCMTTNAFMCEKHDAHGIGSEGCALCAVERDPVAALRAEGAAAAKHGNLHEAEIDRQRWKSFTRIAKLIGFSGVVPASWRDAWTEGYLEVVRARHRRMYGRPSA